ncbi:hypothetical protein IFM89_017603 [Coptis chinensis]|uniref:MORF/ORRM1/DAG-like MORF domain-containing protein n=1 Tax=Coptis chinensis TaxID=261450 RepID=A0A835LEJ4_9MAGN|nr:hypothetical protein IFM89_017603 [Coptis chinensis]
MQKNKVYAVWWKIPFGFCAAIDEDSVNKLKALQDVLVVLPDYSLDIKRNCKFGEVLFVESPWGEVQPFSRLSYSSYGYICEPDDPNYALVFVRFCKKLAILKDRSVSIMVPVFASPSLDRHRNVALNTT